MKKRGYHIPSCILFILGLMFIEPNQQHITGAFLGISPFLNSLTGISLWMIASILFMVGEGELEKKIKLNNKIDRDTGLTRYAEHAIRDQNVEQEMKNLERELAKGHVGAGLGSRHIMGIDVWYMRGRRGARLFYRQTTDNEGNIIYEIVGKAVGTGKKVNENAVIKRLQEIYKN